ncbi:MAG: helix-turn-helix domain-containing protein [Maricaulaceae bacterium]
MTNESDNLDQLLTEKEAAELICYTPRALQNWRLRGGGPEYVKVSARSIRYQRRDVLNWIEERKRKHTSQTFG